MRYILQCMCIFLSWNIQEPGGTNAAIDLIWTESGCWTGKALCTAEALSGEVRKDTATHWRSPSWGCHDKLNSMRLIGYDIGSATKSNCGAALCAFNSWMNLKNKQLEKDNDVSFGYDSYIAFMRHWSNCHTSDWISKRKCNSGVYELLIIHGTAVEVKTCYVQCNIDDKHAIDAFACTWHLWTQFSMTYSWWWCSISLSHIAFQRRGRCACEFL